MSRYKTQTGIEFSLLPTWALRLAPVRATPCKVLATNPLKMVPFGKTVPYSLKEKKREGKTERDRQTDRKEVIGRSMGRQQSLKPRNCL